MKKIFFLLLIFPYFLNVHAQLSSKEQSRIDSLFQTWDKPESPGAALGIIKNGQLVYSKGYGIADLEHDVAITPSSVFYMASVSKHFVTMCILLLEEEGKINLDVEIQEYLPDFPRYDWPLSIRNFIHHTSGVRDYLTLWELAGNSYMDKINEEAVYQLIKNQKSLNFEPGSEYLYSNSCYFMLGMIIEKVSGMSIREFGDTHLFEPLGMKNTHFHNDVYHIIKNRAFSYYTNPDGGYQNLIMRFDLVGSGGLYSNVKDMFLWDQNFYNNKLGEGKEELINKMHEEGLLNNGESTKYAFGLSNGNYRGLRTVSHGGALAGYRTYFLRFPEQQTSIVILANIGNFNSGGQAREVADVVLEDILEQDLKDAGNSEKTSDPKYVKVSTKKLDSYTGTYVIQPGIEIEFSIKNDSLSAVQKWNNEEYSVAGIDNDTFIIPGNNDLKFMFSKMSDGKSNNLTIDQEGNTTICVRKGEIPEVDLQDYIGSFYSEELNVTYEVYLEENILKSRIAYNEPVNLIVSNKDEFTADRAVLNFNRSDNEVTSFVVDAGRVRGIEFMKVGE